MKKVNKEREKRLNLNSKKIFGSLGKDINSVLSIKQFYEQIKEK
jgi:hypothetical protein